MTNITRSLITPLLTDCRVRRMRSTSFLRNQCACDCVNYPSAVLFTIEVRVGKGITTNRLLDHLCHESFHSLQVECCPRNVRSEFHLEIIKVVDSGHPFKVIIKNLAENVHFLSQYCRFPADGAR